jgi:hypothetical protein
LNIYHPLPFEKFDRIVNTSGLRESMGIRVGELHSLALQGKAPAHTFENYERAYFHHVRKTAGTSIAYAFYRLADDPYSIEQQLKFLRFAVRSGYRFVGLNPRLISKGHYFFGSSHLPTHQFTLPRSGTYSFTVLRDPVERVTSLYRYLSNPTADSQYASEAKDYERAWAADGFDSFLDRVPKEHLLNQLYMFSETGRVEEAADALDRMNLVIRTESLAEGVAQLQHDLGIVIDLGVERESKHKAELTDAEQRRLREVMEPEYDLLGRIKAPLTQPASAVVAVASSADN